MIVPTKANNFAMLVEQSRNIIHYSAEKIFSGKGSKEEPAKEIDLFDLR